ncbi:DUF4136 domain-containing protein [Catalinimonas sp. 4WD22]|uniref:DUF4136 domain-containing protein n=1 Tax=Catalinimonas locisalis TaxID=3133978 RepID=UPI003100C663
MNLRYAASFCIGVLLFFAGCYPDGPEYIEDLDTVATLHDPEFDFTSVGTFAIPDSVVKITGNLEEGEPVEFVRQVYASTIAQSIRENMERYGWTEVDREDDPDMIILPSAMQVTNIYYDYWYWGGGYWNWWYPYPWWGWYYPYPVVDIDAYSTGSVFILMTYPDGITAADNIPVVWTGIFNGLLEGSTTSISSRITNNIEQAFDQSPYLTVN